MNPSPAIPTVGPRTRRLLNQVQGFRRIKRAATSTAAAATAPAAASAATTATTAAATKTSAATKATLPAEAASGGIAFILGVRCRGLN